MATVYLAARYSRREEMLDYQRELEEAGHVVNSRWLLGEHQIHPGSEGVDKNAPFVPEEARPFAQDDVEDVANADVVISFTEYPNSPYGRGGRHVEFGYALRAGKQLIIVGPWENIFHRLPNVEQFWNWKPEVIEAIR